MDFSLFLITFLFIYSITITLLYLWKQKNT